MQVKGFRYTGIIVFLLLVTAPCIIWGISVPDSITLNTQSKMYEPFSFNHTAHIQVMNECSYCHHHTTGTLDQDSNCIRCHRNSGETKVVACRGCHLPDPFSAAAIRAKDPKAYHNDKPSLKAAMHRNCIDCHEKMKGPIGCQDCHRRTKEGDALYNSGAYAPKAKPAKGGHGGH